jgi:DNA-binding phage protein
MTPKTSPRETFFDLCNAIARQGRAPTEKPMSFIELAKRAGISRSHFYKLLNGQSMSPDWTIAKIAEGLGVESERVYEAMLASYKGKD